MQFCNMKKQIYYQTLLLIFFRTLYEVTFFLLLPGTSGTPPSVTGRQTNSYARGRSTTTTTSTYQVGDHKTQGKHKNIHSDFLMLICEFYSIDSSYSDSDVYSNSFAYIIFGFLFFLMSPITIISFDVHCVLHYILYMYLKGTNIIYVKFDKS